VLFPFMALTILLGGVTGGELGRVCLTLMIVLFSSLALGLLVSSCTDDGRKSMLMTFGLLLAWAGVPALGLVWKSTLWAAFSVVAAIRWFGGGLETLIIIWTSSALTFLLTTYLFLLGLWHWH